MSRRPVDLFKAALGPAGLLVILALLEVALLVTLGNPLSHYREVQEAASEGKVPWKLDVQLGASAAALIGLVLTVLLLLFRKWWTGPVPSPSTSAFGKRARGGKMEHRLFLFGLLLAVVVGTGLRWNLSGGSLWWDEAWNVRENSHGKFRTSKEGELKFSRSDWQRAAWYYPKPTHHGPMAVASKASLTIWRALGGGSDEEGAFSERAIRAPAIIATIVSLLGIGILLRIWGHPFPGVLASLILAIHPWHIRYGIDARGFPFVVAAVIVALISLTLIIRTRSSRTRWLVLFAFSLWLLMWAFPSGIWYPFALVGVGLWFLRPNKGDGRLASERWRPCGKLLAASVLAAIALFHSYLPAVIQATRWKLADPHFLNGELISNTWTRLVLGLQNQWAGGEDGRGLFSLGDLVGDRQWLSWTLRGALTLLAFTGLGRLFLRREKIAPACVVGIIVAAVAYLVATHLAQHHYYHRYMLHLLPLYVAGLALGLEWLGGLVTRGGGRRRLVGRVLVPTVFLGAFLACLRPQYEVLLTRPYSPLRDVAEQLDRLTKEEEAEVLGLGHGSKIIQLYREETSFTLEPGTAETELAEFIERDNGKPGYVFFGHANFNESYFPEAIQKLRDGNRLGQALVLRGLEPDFTYRIVRVR